ncbi:tetratricopeptide repeat protein [Methanospirillum hungatei]|uniref:tetratricopeptide repeat protein n=1 Tax=Methanospirillum hungatei TaxID=2203 RepID=UPI0026F32F6E|nr:tetratricopeptide repeat protein [Methanospirillum hungatei]MCA1917197.1 tetratricopeptide repeat protein [Methanospirillum hungatei]
MSSITNTQSMRRAITSNPAVCIILLILLFLPAPILAADDKSDSGSGSVDPYLLNTFAASHIQVANISLDPSILMPGDIATATILMENTGKDLPVAISDALVVSKDLKILTGIYEKVGTIGPGNRLPLTFTMQAGITPGIYYPVFTASFRGAHFIRLPFPVIVQDTPVLLTVFSKPDTWVEDKRNQVVLTVMNPRDNPVSSVQVTPAESIHEIMPASSYIGVLDPDIPIQIPFNITPHGNEPVQFIVQYKNGINLHNSSVSVPISTGTSKKQADLFVSNIEITPGMEYVTVKGDVTNAGLEAANAVVVTVQDPARAVYPYKQYGVGLLKPSDFASFQVTFKPSPNATTENLLTSFKDADGRIISTETPLDLTGVTALSDLDLMDPALMGPEPSGILPPGTETIAGIAGGIGIGIGLMYLYTRRKNRSSQKTCMNRKNKVQNAESSMTLEDSDNGGDVDGGSAYAGGMAFYKQGDYKKAAEEFFSVTEADPSNDKAWNAYGICLTKLSEYASAERCYENALKIQPDNQSYQKNRDINRKKMK